MCAYSQGGMGIAWVLWEKNQWKQMIRGMAEDGKNNANNADAKVAN